MAGNAQAPLWRMDGPGQPEHRRSGREAVQVLSQLPVNPIGVAVGTWPCSLVQAAWYERRTASCVTEAERQKRLGSSGVRSRYVRVACGRATFASRACTPRVYVACTSGVRTLHVHAARVRSVYTPLTARTTNRFRCFRRGSRS